MTARELIAGASASVEANYVEDVFSTYLYTGTGASQTITNGIDLATKGGMVWCKGRNYTGSFHNIADTVRGRAYSIFPNATNAQVTSSAGNDISSFNTDGFTLGTPSQTNTNDSGYTFASWTFRKQAKFFDCITWTGNGSNSQTVAHALASQPGFIIIKSTSDATNWFTFARVDASNYALATLNSTSAASSTTITQSNVASSSVLNVGWITSAWSTVNANGSTYVAYLFAHDAGGFGAAGTDSVVSCGSFSSASLQTVTLGWEPQFVLVKSTNVAIDWWIFDDMRGMSQTSDKYLKANTSSAEATFSTLLRPTSTGFTWDGTYAGDSGTSYIYLAIRRGPMKTPTDASKVFAPVAVTGSGANQTVTTGFAPDLVSFNIRGSDNGYQKGFADKLRNAWSIPTNTDAEYGPLSTGNILPTFSNTGYVLGAGSNANGSGSTYIDYAFRRAPGFFDAVCYTGTGSATTVSHNLGVAPELMIVKRRNDLGSWMVYALDATKYLVLNTNQQALSEIAAWNNTSPTSSAFTVYVLGNVNASGGTYVAYLFATCPGVSKVGSYTGSGTTKQIDCGFTNGARFILIKRTDSTGDWYVWDTARGIVSGNDPYLLLNSTAAEVTSTDYIDPYSAGFEISSTAPAAINASGGSYIYLAIA